VWDDSQGRALSLVAWFRASGLGVWDDSQGRALSLVAWFVVLLSHDMS
jgi:hypothetical protein